MIEKLSVYDFPDRKQVPDGYDYRSVPDLSADNIEVLRKKINEIIEYLNANPIWQINIDGTPTQNIDKF
jgi:hypothetical protein